MRALNRAATVLRAARVPLVRPQRIVLGGLAHDGLLAVSGSAGGVPARLASTAAAAPPTPAAAGAGASTAPSQPPLDVELPGIPKLRPARNLPSPTVQVTMLPNGLRVVTQETYSQVSCAALFVDAGSMYEDNASLGVSHFLESCAFRATEKRSGDAVLAFTARHGITTQAVANREVMMYKADCLRGSAEQGIELIAEAALTPLLNDAEVDAARRTIAFQREEALCQPQTLVTNHLYMAAYGHDTPLGRPEKCPDDRIATVTPAAMKAYRDKFFTARRMVLSVVGVDHEVAVAAAERAFGGVPSGDATAAATIKRPLSPYIGGDVRSSPDWSAMPATIAAATAKTEFTHMMIGFPTVGWSDDDVVPVCVVDTLLGGGSSFSAGGPGKGMYSRLYREVLNANPSVEAANAFSSQLYDCGLVGIYCAAAPEVAGGLVNVIEGQLARLVNEKVEPTDLARARNQLASSVMMNLETRGLLCEDIGRQFLSHGKRMDPAELVRRIQGVTNEDIARVMRHALSHPPSFAAVGDLSTVPTYDAIRHTMDTFVRRYMGASSNPLSIFKLG